MARVQIQTLPEETSPNPANFFIPGQEGTNTTKRVSIDTIRSGLMPQLNLGGYTWQSPTGVTINPALSASNISITRWNGRSNTYSLLPSPQEYYNYSLSIEFYLSPYDDDYDNKWLFFFAHPYFKSSQDQMTVGLASWIYQSDVSLKATVVLYQKSGRIFIDNRTLYNLGPSADIHIYATFFGNGLI